MAASEEMTRFKTRAILLPAVFMALLLPVAWGQTDCADGNGVLDSDPPKNITVAEIIQKFTAQESKLREARTHYTYNQDVMVQTLSGTAVDGQYHEVTDVSFDAKGNRAEKVTFSEQSTLRGIALSAEDTNDIRVFMQWFLTTDELPQYTLTYSGSQHVDDLDTYVFHVEPKKEEKNKRYFQGRVWVDNRDLQVVKLCGKSVPEVIQKKKKKDQVQDIRPTFVSYRQLVDKMWLPAYTRVDDTLHFNVTTVHVRETVKLTGYKRAEAAGPPAKQ